MEIRPLFIVMLDISGYTRFTRMHRTSMLHAEKIIADLLQAMTQSTEHPLILNKTEGDALLLYADATDDPIATGHNILRQVLACFATFTDQLQKLVFCNTCVCDACRQSGELKIKAIVHFDDAVVRESNGVTEIAGEGVILAHRLMKNSLESDEYVLMTPAARENCGAVDGFREVKGREKYDELGSCDIFAYVPPTVEATEKQPGFSFLAKLRGLRYFVVLVVYALKRLILRRPAQGQFRNLPE